MSLPRRQCSENMSGRDAGRWSSSSLVRWASPSSEASADSLTCHRRPLGRSSEASVDACAARTPTSRSVGASCAASTLVTRTPLIAIESCVSGALDDPNTWTAPSDETFAMSHTMRGIGRREAAVRGSPSRPESVASGTAQVAMDDGAVLIGRVKTAIALQILSSDSGTRWVLRFARAEG